MEDQRAPLGTQGHGSVHGRRLEGFRSARPVSLHGRERHASIPTDLRMQGAGSRAGVPSGTTPSLKSLADRVNQLARRAARLNDQAEVTNLQDTYGYAVDRKLWDQVADLFAEDGTLELGLQGVYVGKASIRHALDQFGPQGLRAGELNDHVYLQTLVSVAPDGRTANARGVELIMSSAPGGGELSEGVFENTFIKENRTWKIQSVHFYPRMIVDAASGWAKSAKPAPGPSQEFPPDRPPTASYEIYPKFAVAPFHFDNPVTGKPPQYPEGVQAIARPAAAAARRERTGDSQRKGLGGCFGGGGAQTYRGGSLGRGREPDRRVRLLPG